MQTLDAQFGDTVSFARLHLFVVSVSYCYLTLTSVFVNASSDFDFNIFVGRLNDGTGA